MTKNLLNAGCGTHYAKGWVNVDIWSDEKTRPDVVAKANEPYPFPDNYFDAIYLGHVLEHIDWNQVPVFLKDMRRIAKPGAPILVVGPDVYKTLDRWKEGQEPLSMVLSVLEHQDINPDNPDAEWWDGATHHWNCHNDRVQKLLEKTGFSTVHDVYEEIPNCAECSTWDDKVTGINWPVVGKWFWQFAIKCEA